ncbi:nucleoside-diphosphate-sugar epimerase [Lysobacter sp. OAE881]|uniref:NAD-dependent epimerase/dehydratase family protein n=1 Tax=Lysobacter sp. OAE881 TaxID=2663813 RepID=UPI0017898594
MIIGSGLLARNFAPRYQDDSHVVIFASGVSNSLESRPEAFERERNLLRGALADTDAKLVYFGSCAVCNIDEELSPYLLHKREMEKTVLESGHGLVLRLPQVVGRSGNPNTLGSFIRDCLLTGKHFSIWRNAERNLMDVEDIVRIAEVLIERHEGESLSIASRHSIRMPELVSMFEEVLGVKANFSLIDRGTPLAIDSVRALAVANEIGIDLGADYARKVIRKYYGLAD